MASSGGEGESDNDDYEYAYSSGEEDDDDDMNNNYAVDDDDRMDISNSSMKVQLDKKKPSVTCTLDNPNAAPTSTSFRGMYKTLGAAMISTLQLGMKLLLQSTRL